jgi:hypothetical protein
MPSVTYASCHVKAIIYAERCYAGRRYAKCRYAECRSACVACVG